MQRSENKKDELIEQLKDGIKNVLTGENFKSWLESQGRFYFNNYSFRNSMLVFLQNPDASYVMGYEKWKDYGRQVRQSAESIKIIMPVFASDPGEKGGLYSSIRNDLTGRLKNDPNLQVAKKQLGQSKLMFTLQKNGIWGLEIDGKANKRFASSDEVKKFIDNEIIGKVPIYYKVGYVFDVADTVQPETLWVKSRYTKEELVLSDDGEPIKNKRGEYKIKNSPERIGRFVETLDTSVVGDPAKAEILFEALKKICFEKGISVRIENPENDAVLKSGAEGYCNHKKNCIVVSKELSAARRAAVTLHEMAHSDLHGNTEKLEKVFGEHLTKTAMEIQAEAVAYMTAKRFGIETDVDSFNYLAVYSDDLELSDLEKSLEIICKESKSLTRDIESALLGLGYNLALEPKKKIHEAGAEALGKEFASIYVEKSDKYDEILKNMINDAAADTDVNEDERGIIENQILHAKNLQLALAEIYKLLQKLQTANADEVFDIASRLETERLKVYQAEDCIEMLAEKRLNLSDKKDFDKDPQGFIKELAKDHEAIKSLTQKEIDYISVSRYVHCTLGKMLRHEESISAFVDVVKNRLSAAERIKSKNGVFFEINFCESWGNQTVLKNGELCHPKYADRAISEAEATIREYRKQAQAKGEYYPYHKLDVTMYVPRDKRLTALNAGIDVGDGTQESLTTYLQETSFGKSADRTEFLAAYLAAMKDKNWRDRHTVVDAQDKIAKGAADETQTKEMSLSAWRENIADKDTAPKEKGPEKTSAIDRG
jgi:hypothetical protein